LSREDDPPVIQSTKVILCRAILGVLKDRGIHIHLVAEQTHISIVELRRLLEFGSPLEPPEAERLIAWGMKMALASPGHAGRIHGSQRQLDRLDHRGERGRVGLA
jgi:hypothetical protein